MKILSIMFFIILALIFSFILCAIWISDSTISHNFGRTVVLLVFVEAVIMAIVGKHYEEIEK